jgi:hypothetical protein
MINDELIGRLLRWRLAQAEMDAPPAPRALRLLEMARPWWETGPDQFQALWARLGKIQVVYGHAMVESSASRGGGYPVPALIVRVGEAEVETSVRVLYLSIREERMSLRFYLEGLPENTDESFEVTFVSEASALPLFNAQATRSVDSEYRLDVELAEKMARDWKEVRVMDRMPFRLIFRLPVKAA